MGTLRTMPLTSRYGDPFSAIARRSPISIGVGNILLPPPLRYGWLRKSYDLVICRQPTALYRQSPTLHWPLLKIWDRKKTEWKES
jgi:hypothetical protein